jgi:hypothetical protein
MNLAAGTFAVLLFADRLGDGFELPPTEHLQAKSYMYPTKCIDVRLWFADRSCVRIGEALSFSKHRS